MNYKLLINKVIYAIEIQELGDFLISNRPFFYVFVRTINIEKNNILSYIKKKFIEGKVIEESQFNEFKALWDKFDTAVKSKDNNVKQGDLLEYLITKVKKPLKLVFNNLDYESECKVYEDKGLTNICSNNCDIDVVLYNLEKVEVDEYFIHFNSDIEFLECKQDVNSFLYINDKDKVRMDTLKKLEMFKDIKITVGQADVKYIIPSFVTPGRIQKNYLNHNGYEFIEVVDGKELEHILFS